MELEGWEQYDYEDKGAHPLPKLNELVWVYDEFYGGVTLGWREPWSGDAWSWYTLDNKDDCGVTFWHVLHKPEPPKLTRTDNGT